MAESSSRGKREKTEAPADANKGTIANDAADSNKSGLSGFMKKLRSMLGTSKRLEDMTVREIFSRHPLFRLGRYIATPWILYLAWFYIRLQHPEYFSKATLGLINLRPAVHGTDTPRQFLIVAPPSSGTKQMASTLRSQLSLEIGHERTDAAWQFTRDGTVSWIHGMRFLTEPKKAQEKVEAIAKICNSLIDTDTNMGYHPENYGPPRGGCSYRRKYGNECWRNECYVTLLKDHGCASSKSCEINFVKYIHQVRHPMRNLESLVAKYCMGGVDGMSITTRDFLTYASAFFPSHDFYADSCVEATGTFMAMYQEAMIEARARGDIDAFYRIEDSSACDVARMGGLLSADETVYEPNYKRIYQLCDTNRTNNLAEQVVEQKVNKVNMEKVKLGWLDLRGGMHGSKRKEGDKSLERRIRKLFVAFGYDESMVPLQYDHEKVHSEL